MVRTTRSKRLLGAAVSALTAVSLLAGCGGSPVSEAQGAEGGSQAPLGAEQETAPSETAGVAIPGAPATPAATAGSGASAAPAPGARSGTAAGTPAGPAADKPGKTGAAAAPQSATTTAGAVEALVSSHPIFGGRTACRPATLSEVNIGNVSTLSGILGELFAPVTPALNTFVTSQNACGGLNGHRIKFTQVDDQGDPATAVSKAQDMILKNKVIAFVGNIQVLTIDAAAPIYKRYGIPVIGGDISQNTWFGNPVLFPQGSPGQSVGYGELIGLTEYHKVTKVGSIWCIEVPRSCEQVNRAMKELAPKLGATFLRETQASMTAPSYVQQCLDFKNAGVEGLALQIDAASMVRMARSCTQVGYHPKLAAYPLAVGNEGQFLGNSWLGNAYVPMNTFPWQGNSTPAEKYWQAAVAKYNPGFTSGGAASLGWTAGALLVAASATLSETNPTSQQFLDALWTFQGQKFTELGGLSGPKFFAKDKTPRVPYCLFAAISNDQNTGWKKVVSKPTCTDQLAPSDPQSRQNA